MAELDEILALETQVWEALVRGDAAADAALLEDGFLGVYSIGFSDKAGHVGQLAGGPSVAHYRIEAPRLLDLGPEMTLLAYRATFTRAGAAEEAEEEAMYVSSLWRRGAQGWRNIFSQDTEAGTRAPV